MNYLRIKIASIENGTGCRTSLFVAGCTHHCKGCFNPETWAFDAGEPFTEAAEDYLVDTLKAPYVDGLTILGGEPMEPENQPAVRKIVERVKAELPEKTIWIYSGYTFEELLLWKRCHTDDTLPILKSIDVLVDGEFVETQKDITLKFRGSKNQRIIDVKKTLEQEEVVLLFQD